MKTITEYDIEKMFIEQLKEVMGGENAINFKKADPIQYEIGLSEFEKEIEFNLEQCQILDSTRKEGKDINPWIQIDLLKYGNEEALYNTYEIPLYFKRRNEIITEITPAENVISFETEKEAKVFFKYLKQMLRKKTYLIKNKSYEELINPNGKKEFQM